jgi:hypothetical protein
VVVAAGQPIVLRVQGNLYLLEIESEAGGLDWLARVILSVTAKPQYVSDIVRCFGLPRRLLEDAIGQLVEDHLLLIDVSRGQVRASGLPLSAHTTRPVQSSVLVWQDHVTGTLLPWEWIRPFCDRARGRGDEGVKDLVGGPPRKHVLEMSDAELLTHLERFRPGASWAEVIVRRERIERRATMFLNAEVDADNRLTIFDQVPSLLVRQWGRVAPIGRPGAVAGYRIDLPEAWSTIVASWASDTSRRIRDYRDRKEPDREASRRLFGRVRESIERYSGLELVDDAPVLLRRRVQDRSEGALHHRLVVATSDVAATWSDALPLFRMSLAEQRYVLLATDSAKEKHMQAVQAAGGDVKVSPRMDVELLLLNDRELWVGGVQQNRRLALCLRAARPLQPLLAWLPHTFAWDATSLGRSQREEHVVAYGVLRDAIALDEGLRELETTPSEQAPNDQLVARLQHDIEEVEKALNALNPRDVMAIDAEDLFDALEEREGARLLLRNEKSPLSQFSNRHEVVIWSAQRPSPSYRWLQEPGLCEIAIVDDVVAFGWWSYPGSELPPFIAVHAPGVAAALRARSDKATVVAP